MLKMPSFGTNTSSETFVPLVHCVPSHDRTSSDAVSVHRRHELMSVANVSKHASINFNI